MAYLENEIARLNVPYQAAQQTLAQLQQELAALVQQRNSAQSQRTSAQTQLDALQPLITERDQKQSQLTSLEAQEAQQNSLAASYASMAAGLRQQVSPLSSQLASLQAIAAQIPNLQADVAYWQEQVEIFTAALQAHDESRPSNPSELYEWQQERVQLAQQKNAAVQSRIQAQAALSNAQNQIVPIPSLQQQITSLNSSAASYDAQQQTALQAAASYRTQAQPLRDRLAQLNPQLSGVPALQSQIASTTATINSLGPQIAAKEAAIVTAQANVTATRQPYDQMVALAAAVAQTPLDRPALQQAAATLAAQLEAMLAAQTAARTRETDATRRGVVVTAVRDQRQLELNGVIADRTAAQTEMNTLGNQVNAKLADIQAREANLATMLEQIDDARNDRPVYADYNNAQEFAAARAMYWDNLEGMQEAYETELAAMLSARQELVTLQSAYTQAQSRWLGLDTRVTGVQNAVNVLNSQRNTLVTEAQTAQAEATALEPAIGEFRVARETATARLLGMLGSGLPILFFPVRLETRLTAANQLLVRIYPDDIHADSHEPELTAEERTWRQHFLQATTAASSNEGLKKAAWQQLATRFGPARAAWVAQAPEPAAGSTPRPASWTRAAHSEVMPDRWVILGYQSGRLSLTAWSGPRVPDPLPVGPSPAAPVSRTDPFQDPGIAWMVDFNAAVQAGMALSIPLNTQQAQQGFDRLIVLGLKGFLASKDEWLPADAQEATTRLVRLLDAQHYTRGLAFIPQNTPTNNTGQEAAGYASLDPLDEQLYLVERGPALIQAGDGSDGTLAATVLGLNLATFAHVSQANGREQDDARLSNVALWPILQSYFLEAILAAPAASASADHFAAFVRGRGPLPSLRIGNQPYGLLPVTSLARWFSQPGQEDASLAPRLHGLRPVWRLFGERAFQAARNGNVAHILAQQPDACRYLIRGVGSVNRNGELPATAVVAPFAARLSSLSSRPPATLQALVTETLDLGSFRLDAWITSLATRRLLNLRLAGSSGIHLGSYGWIEDFRPAAPVVTGTSQGYLQAPSLAQAATAAILRSGYLAHQGSGQGDALAVDLSSDRVRRARWLLDGVREGQSLGALLGYRFERALQDHGLPHYIAPFRVLAALVEDEPLALAMAEEQTTEASYQELVAQQAALVNELDAAGLALQPIQAELGQRTAERDQRQGLKTQLTDGQAVIPVREAAVAAAQQAIQNHWANRPRSRVNRPSNPATDVANEVEVPSGGTITSWHTTRQQLQAALNQANADLNAAVAHRDNLAGGPNRYTTALNNLNNEIAWLNGEISSLQGQRNHAQQVVDQLTLDLYGADGNGGVRREKEDAQAVWLNAAQTLHTLLQQRWQQASESVAAHNVVDGLELHRRWRMGSSGPEARWNVATIPWGDTTVGLPAAGTTDHGRLEEQLAALDEMVDAVSDLLVAEGVYQLVQGNSARAGATLEAIATGRVAPPELEVVRTPRTGIAVTHRVLVLSTATPPATPPWAASPQNRRALAEPYLNGWLTQLLAPPAQVRCRVTYLQPTTGQVLTQTELALNTLQLSPLDALYLAESTGNAQQSELEQRLAYQAMLNRPAAVPADSGLRLDFQRNPAWAASVVSVAEFLENVRATRAFVTAARTVDARDLALPGLAPSLDINLTELEGRANSAALALQQAYNALLAVPSQGSNVAAALRAALLPLAGFGISGAVPASATGEGQAARDRLTEQAHTAGQEAARRLERLQQHDSVAPGSDVAARRDFQVERLQLIFGEGFKVLPQLNLSQAAAATQAFDPARQLEGSEPLAAVTWLQQISQVREGVNRFHTALAYAEALNSGASLTLRVGQLPYAAGDRWAALPTTTANPTIQPGRLSLVAHLPAGFQFSQPLVGLLVDEWVEMIPGRTEIAGVAFHFDQPNAQPPQSLLLAVPPDIRASRTPAAWDLDTLEATLRETADLTRVRLAAPEQFNVILAHSFRQADGRFALLTNVDEATGKKERWLSLAIAGVNQNLHLTATAPGGKLWHSRRFPDSSWQPFEDVGGVAGDRGTFSEVACAGIGDTLHLCAISSTGLWHTIRFANGSWQPFGDVTGVAGNQGVPQRVACAAIGQELHVCLVTQDGGLWHTIRHADGSWLPFANVEWPAGDRGHILSVVCAAVNGTLHLCATSTTGLWHTVRTADGNWTSFGDVQGQTGARGYVEEIACAGIGPEFHLRVLTSDARVWHTTRLANGSWLAFHEVAGLGQARRITCATVGPTLHVLDAAADPLSTKLYFASSALDLNALPG